MAVTPGAGTGAHCSDWSQRGPGLDPAPVAVDVLRAYLAGPMTGLPDWNYPTFHRVAALLRAAGLDVVNPAENPSDPDATPHAAFMRHDLAILVASEPPIRRLILLPGWAESCGARIEVMVADALGLSLLEFVESGVPGDADHRWALRLLSHAKAQARMQAALGAAIPEESTLEEAQRLVHGDRGADYGHPIDDFTRTAALWNALLRDRFHGQALIQPADVPQLMILLKLSREQHRPKRDNRVDVAGYAETLEMVRQEEMRRYVRTREAEAA